MVEFSTIHHIGFAVGVGGILFAAKCLFDIADSAKRLVAAWVPEDEEEEDGTLQAELDKERADHQETCELLNQAQAKLRSMATNPADSGAQVKPGAAHVNPDLTTKTESAS